MNLAAQLREVLNNWSVFLSQMNHLGKFSNSNYDYFWVILVI